MDRRRIGIIIPALNEAATIAYVVTAVKAFGTPIVIDDGSNDETAELARTSGAVVIKNNNGRGYEAAINGGFSYAASQEFQYLLTMDADGQHEPQALKLFIKALDEGADLVVGVRNKFQRFSEQIFSWFASIKWGLKDPLCGLKAYRVGLYDALGHFDSYGSVGTELALFAAKNDMKIVQLPIVTSLRRDAPRFGSGWQANKKIIRALWLGLVTSAKVT